MEERLWRQPCIENADTDFSSSREKKSRKHVHVATADGEAKYWLEPDVALANNYRLSSRQLNEVEAIVRKRKDEIEAAWQRHFRR